MRVRFICARLENGSISLCERKKSFDKLSKYNERTCSEIGTCRMNHRALLAARVGEKEQQGDVALINCTEDKNSSSGNSLSTPDFKLAMYDFGEYHLECISNF